MATTDGAEVAARFETARQCLAASRRQAVDEREAFRAFETRLRGLHASAPAGGGTVPATVQRLAATGTRAVRDAYEATVMAVPHYTEVYNEPYARNVERELGSEAATILTEQQVFDRPDRRAVLDAVRDARRRRACLVGVLDAEAESLADFADRLTSVALALERLNESRAAAPSHAGSSSAGEHAEFATLRATCEETFDRRRAALVEQRRTVRLPCSDPDVSTRVYRSLDTTYPVLVTATALRGEIERRTRPLNSHSVRD